MHYSLPVAFPWPEFAPLRAMQTSRPIGEVIAT